MSNIRDSNNLFTQRSDFTELSDLGLTEFSGLTQHKNYPLAALPG